MSTSLRHSGPAFGSTSTAPTGEPISKQADSGGALPSQLNLMSLPTELHLAISKHLIYPDALSLKHTNRHFYSLVFTGVKLKVAWLMERRSLHLECPNDRRCDLGSDLRFCRGSVPYVFHSMPSHVDLERLTHPFSAYL
ncbi:f-box domain-containing [Paramyrothecium foliicola]|nr:f-box domain-containing [Paramyrothecium foliicola]